ncbi:MAG: LysR substrate-binding domain-containing protein [Pseudomonadota bacterium]
MTPENIRIEVSSISAGREAALAGLGVLNLPESEVGEDVAAGRLIEVLPEWKLPKLGVYAVWPDTAAEKRLTKRLIDFLVS